jgi:hypothetical protein
MKLVRLIRICLNETYSEVRIGKHLSDSFPIQNGLKQRDTTFTFLFRLLCGLSMCKTLYSVLNTCHFKIFKITTCLGLNWPSSGVNTLPACDSHKQARKQRGTGNYKIYIKNTS